jgi:hypothetical protein
LIFANFQERSTVRDGPKLSDDSGKVPQLNGVVGGSIIGRKIVSLLDEKLAKWSNASCVTTKKEKEKHYTR